MSDRIFYQDVSLANNQLYEYRVENVATNPVPPTTPYPDWVGRQVYNTTDSITYSFDGTVWISGGGGDITDVTLSGDVTSPTSPDGNVTTTVAFVGGKTAVEIADAVNSSHDQNTDTGTDSTSFIIDSGNVNGLTLNNSGGTLEVNNVTNTALADIRVNNLFVEGTTTVIESTVVTVGDNILELNDQVTTNATNSTGGVAIKRLQVDNTTRADAEMLFNESSDKWEVTYGDTASTVTKELGLTHRELFGDGVANTFTITHNLREETVSFSIRKVSNGTYVEPKIVSSTANTITVEFKGKTPTANEFEILVQG